MDEASGLWMLTDVETAAAITGGVITGGNSQYGGGVRVEASGTFNMYGGTICGNAAMCGGGVYVAGSCTMNGGEICENKVLSFSYCFGGGVYVANGSSFTPGGTAKIIDNKKIKNDSSYNNVYLEQDTYITLGTGKNAPASGMSVGITTESVPTVDVPVQITANGTAKEVQYFFADDTQYYVAKNASDNYLELRVPGANSYRIQAAASEHGAVYPVPQEAEANTDITLEIYPDSDYRLKSLKYNDGTDHSITADTQGSYVFTMPAANVTVTAKFEKISGSTGAPIAWDTGKPVKTAETVPEKVSEAEKVKETKNPEQTEEPEKSLQNSIIMQIGNLNMKIFGNSVVNDAAPLIRNNCTMLPARPVAEALGAKVFWNEEARKVTVQKGTLLVEILVDSDVAYINGEPVQLDSPAFIENDRTYVPMRFLAEALGATVEWNAETQEVIITPASRETL